MKIILEHDDLHPDPSVDCLEIAEQLLGKYPSLILNFFVPTYYNKKALFLEKEWCKRLQKLVEEDRVCVGIHGHSHGHLEFLNKSYQDAVISVKASEAILNTAGIPYAMAFRGPYWAINTPTIEALIDLQYTHLYSHVSYDHLTDPFKEKIKIVHYNFNLANTWPNLENPLESDICVAHGHTSPIKHLSCGNSIWDIYPKIEKLIEEENPLFMRLDEYV